MLLAILMAGAHAPSGGAAPAAPPATCMRVESALAPGDFPISGDLAPADCPGGEVKPAFRYDAAAGAVRALRDIAAGELVPAVPATLVAGVRPGQPVTLSAQVGAVTVRRQVEALRAALPGRRLLVRSADGAIFSVPYPEVE